MNFLATVGGECVGLSVPRICCLKGRVRLHGGLAQVIAETSLSTGEMVLPALKDPRTATFPGSLEKG